jgi:hypothetical protein
LLEHTSTSTERLRRRLGPASAPPGGDGERGDVSPRLLDPFRGLASVERRRHLADYERHLTERDGTLDLRRRTLARRERYLEDLARKPVRWCGEFDFASFQMHFGGGKGPAPDLRTAWLVAAAEANEGECYGVDLELRRFAQRHPNGEGADIAYLHLLLQEHYHTRILKELCRTCGLEVELQRPGLSQRAVIRLMMGASAPLALVLAARLWAACLDPGMCSLFSSQREVEDRLRSRRDLSRRDPASRLRTRVLAIRVARWIAPRWLRRDAEVPQVYTLGCSQREFVACPRRGLEIPLELDWRSGPAVRLSACRRPPFPCARGRMDAMGSRPPSSAHR